MDQALMVVTSMTDQAIADVVTAYAPKGIAAHDLRRTFAKLAHKGERGA